MAAAAGAAEAAVRRRRRGQDKNPQNPRKLFTSPRVRTAGIRQPGVRSGPKALLFVIHDSGTPGHGDLKISVAGDNDHRGYGRDSGRESGRGPWGRGREEDEATCVLLLPTHLHAVCLR